MDWGQGRYERIAEQVQPAAEELIALAAPRARERVADLGTGTGNAALLAAERGSRVVGVDPSERLLSIAAERAGERGVDLGLRVGNAASIPIEDGWAELLTSVFGVIFAPDAEAAGAEMARITAPGGRIVLSAWLPEGAIAAASRMARGAVAAATSARAGPPPFPWHERGALEDLLGPHGFGVELAQRDIAFRGPSAREWFDQERRYNPMRVEAAGVLSGAQREELAQRSLDILEGANEDPAAFQVTSRYVIATACRAS